MQPVRYFCLIQVDYDPKEEKQTDGGIWLPAAQNERHELAKQLGTFISSGGIAFTGGDGAPPWPKWNIPKPGNKVLFNRYGGSLEKGKDGKYYRLVQDTELGAIVEEDYEG
jgi:co-chaperonin GroES (HSP10)